MKHDFAPFKPDAVWLLTKTIGIDYTHDDFTAPQWLCVTGREDDGELLGCCMFEFKTPWEAYFSIAIVDPKCINRRIMRAMFTAVFSRAVRITAEIVPGNARAEGQVRRLGFVYEGFKRLGLEGNRDALQYGMLRADCRFLPGWHPARTSIIPLALGGQHGHA